MDWRDVISLKHSAEEIWDTETGYQKRDWGKLLHLVLSSIHYSEQKEEVIERMYQLGKFSSDDNKKLREIINELLKNDKVKHFDTSCFSGKYITDGVTEEYLKKIGVNR